MVGGATRFKSRNQERKKKQLKKTGPPKKQKKKNKKKKNKKHPPKNTIGVERHTQGLSMTNTIRGGKRTQKFFLRAKG